MPLDFPSASSGIYFRIRSQGTKPKVHRLGAHWKRRLKELLFPVYFELDCWPLWCFIGTRTSNSTKRPSSSEPPTLLAVFGNTIILRIQYMALVNDQKKFMSSEWALYVIDRVPNQTWNRESRITCILHHYWTL